MGLNLEVRFLYPEPRRAQECCCTTSGLRGWNLGLRLEVLLYPEPRRAQETENAAKAAAKQAAQDLQRRRAEAEKRRKKQSMQFRKKTKSGQPVMAYRVNKILGQLEAGH